MPPTKAEAEGKKKPSWSKINEYRKQREKDDFEWEQAKLSHQAFAAFIDKHVGAPWFTLVTGEPPPEAQLSLEEYRVMVFEKKKEQAKETDKRLTGILERAVERGGTFQPVDPSEFSPISEKEGVASER